MPHRITPIFNGITNIRFKHSENETLPDFENIPHFLYLITTEDNRHIIVDTGFDIYYVPGMNSDGNRDKDFAIPVILQSKAIAPEEIDTVIMTHLHWDHTGGMKHFSNAQFFVQGDEFNHMLQLNPNEETYYCPAHWLPFLDKVSIVNGEHTLQRGIDLLRTGGHTRGHQVIKVKTERGVVILAGDEPFNYDALWQMIPESGWNKLKEKYKDKFYWSREEVEHIQEYIQKNNLQTQSVSDIYTLDVFKKSGYRIFYTHDKRLKLGVNSDI